MVEYYLVQFVCQSKEYNTLWFSDNSDGFLVDASCSRILVFFDRAAADKAAHNRGGRLHEGITSINCDMLLCLTSSRLDCNTILNFWNVVSDIAVSLAVSFFGDSNESQIHCLYEKLFYGCNLPAIKKDGESKYMPTWSKNEVKLLQKVVDSGLDIIKKYIC